MCYFYMIRSFLSFSFLTQKAPMKLFYRVQKSTKKLSSNLKYLKQIPSMHLKTISKNWENEKSRQKTPSKDLNTSSKSHHNLKIIIAKKSRIKNRNNGYEQPNKERLNKHNSTNFSSNTKDSERTRSDVEFCSYFASSSQSSTSSSTSEKKSSISNENCEVRTYQNNSLPKKKSSTFEKETRNDSEKNLITAYLKQSINKKERNQNVQLTSSSNMKANIPKLKVGVFPAKNKITVPSSPADVKSNFIDVNKKMDTPLKKVRFESLEDVEKSYSNEQDEAVVDQLKYAHQIGLRPVVRTVESIILHRKRKKSKHSKDADYCKRPKVHVSSTLNENLKLKLKITGKNSYKNSKKVEDDNCNLNSLGSARSSSVSNQYTHNENVNEEQTKRTDTEKNVSSKNKEGGGLENYKYSLTEQLNVEFGSNSTPTLIPKLVINHSESSSNGNKVNTSEKDTIQKNSQNMSSENIKTQSSANPNPINFKSVDFPIVSKSPTAKMGSPKQNSNSTFQINPIRPQSIPASLNLSYSSHSPTYMEFNTQKRSVSTEEDSFSNKNKHVLFPFSSSKKTEIQKTYSLNPSNNNNNNNNYPPLSPLRRVANLTVKDPTKLFPNACPSIEILKIPQKVTLKPNFKLPETIPLEKIKKSARMVLPKSNNDFYTNEGTMAHAQYSNSQIDDNYSGNFQSRFNIFSNDINLERYTSELKNDIAKLDRNLSMEKNYEHWEKQKLEEYNRIQQTNIANLAFPQSPKNQIFRSEISNQKSLSVRNVPNPSAIAMSRNQSSDSTHNDLRKSFTFRDHRDIEDILVQTKISKSQESTLR